MIALQGLFAAFAFFCGSLPFSVWVGKYGLQKDIRDYGDGNPGTFNVLRAGGLTWGGLALMLDISKGAFPVGLAAQVFGWDGLALIVIAIMPVLGHAFSPFLGFKGGKAIATTGGIWIGLALVEAPLVFGVALVFWYLVLTSSAWATMFTFATALIYFMFTGKPALWFAVLALNWLIVLYKHRHELTTLPALKVFTRSTG
ncbi:MAG: glycerol-3-phosphate acyltransferase [Aggregatilineales bacterium]